MTHHAHAHGHAPAAGPITCWVITVSDTRTDQTDTSGSLLASGLEGAGHEVARRVLVPDEPDRIEAVLSEADEAADLRAILLTGGTGITKRDVTYEVVDLWIARPIPGFGELFRMLSYQEVGSAAMLSRATAGVTAAGKLLFALPGSTAGCRTALEKLILPELRHMVSELDR